MFDKNINLKLINIALLAFTIGVLFFTYPFWGTMVNRIISIFTPFIIAFAIAYALYPFLHKMESKGIPKALGMGIIIVVILGVLTAVFYTLIPMLYEQILSLVNISIDGVKEISTKLNLDLSSIQNKLTDIGTLTSSLGGDISDIGINIISKSISLLVLCIVCFIVSMYFLAEMKTIRNWLEKLLIRRKNNKRLRYFKELDNQMSNYFEGLETYMLIRLVEYTLAYFLIGNPYFLILGILTSLATIIPYFGGMASNVVALITAALISPKLFILTVIVTFILPIIDEYIISPRVYAKSNNMHPLIIIFTVFACGILAGVVGIVIALPLAIIITCTYKFYEKEIIETIKDHTD
mgnify:CR=1 FL=1